MHSIWGAGQMAWTKSIFVVDEGEDVHDTHGVLRAAGALCDPARDIEEVNGPLDILDHAAPNLGVGKKIGFDCTRKNSAERDGDAVSVRTAPTAEAAERLQGGVRAIEGVVAASIPESSGRYWLFVGIRKERPGQGIEIAERVVELALGEASPPPYIVVVDGSVDVANVDEVMFHWCANGDAGRDVVRRGGADGRSVFAMDATAKTPADARNGKKVREWPPILRMDPAVEARVGLRWREYGIPGTGGGDA